MTRKKVVGFSKKKIYSTSGVLGAQQPKLLTGFTHWSPMKSARFFLNGVYLYTLNKHDELAFITK